MCGHSCGRPLRRAAFRGPSARAGQACREEGQERPSREGPHPRCEVEHGRDRQGHRRIPGPVQRTLSGWLGYAAGRHRCGRPVRPAIPGAERACRCYDRKHDAFQGQGCIAVDLPIDGGGRRRAEGRGICTLYPFAAGSIGSAKGPADPTFYPYGPKPGAAPTSVSGGTIAMPVAVPPKTKVAALTPAAIAQVGLSPTGNYVLFGLGSHNSMVGRNMANAPVHFSDDAFQVPNYYYQRFGVIFKIGFTNAAGKYTSLGQAVSRRRRGHQPR